MIMVLMTHIVDNADDNNTHNDNHNDDDDDDNMHSYDDNHTNKHNSINKARQQKQYTYKTTWTSSNADNTYSLT